MISQPILLTAVLGSVVTLVFYLSKAERTMKFFKFLPVPLWCYFIPTLLSTFELIPATSSYYGLLGLYLLPTCLFLLLVGTDIPSLLKVGRKSLAAMLAGSIGIMLGSSVTFILLLKFNIAAGLENGEDLWKGWGCLTASWTGGSANMLSVKEILQAPESIFSNLIIVDTVVAYAWMALLVFLSKYQKAIDRKLGASEEWENLPDGGFSQAHKKDLGFLKKISYGILLSTGAFVISIVIWAASSHLPNIGTVINRKTWAIISIMTAALLLSLSPARKLENYGASNTGNFLLCLLLTTFGARANLGSLLSSPVFLFLGLLWVAIHGTVLISFGKLFKVPMAILATSSQANLGGPVSAPIVGSVYRNNLAPVGVILAVFGNIYGIYFGLFAAEICKRLSNLL